MVSKTCRKIAKGVSTVKPVFLQRDVLRRTARSISSSCHCYINLTRHFEEPPFSPHANYFFFFLYLWVLHCGELLLTSDSVFSFCALCNSGCSTFLGDCITKDRQLMEVWRWEWEAWKAQKAKLECSDHLPIDWAPTFLLIWHGLS